MRPEHNLAYIEFVGDPREDPVFLAFWLRARIEVEPEGRVSWGNLFRDLLRSLRVDLVRESIDVEYVRQTAAQAADLCRLVVNSSSYATSASADIQEVVSEWRQKQEALRRTAGARRARPAHSTASHTTKYRLGSTIRIEYGAPRAGERNEEACQSRRILKRFLVRGHWRWQPHGPHRAERKHIWIRPFWKGPADMAELLRRKYLLK